MTEQEHVLTVEARDNFTIDLHCVDPCQRIVWASGYLDPALKDITKAAAAHRRAVRKDQSHD